jgi:hypothetical protein
MHASAQIRGERCHCSSISRPRSAATPATSGFAFPSDGMSSVHVEFDSHDAVAIIAKIPDESRSAAARVATPPPVSAKP